MRNGCAMLARLWRCVPLGMGRATAKTMRDFPNRTPLYPQTDRERKRKCLNGGLAPSLHRPGRKRKRRRCALGLENVLPLCRRRNNSRLSTPDGLCLAAKPIAMARKPEGGAVLRCWSGKYKTELTRASLPLPAVGFSAQGISEEMKSDWLHTAARLRTLWGNRRAQWASGRAAGDRKPHAHACQKNAQML